MRKGERVKQPIQLKKSIYVTPAVNVIIDELGKDSRRPWIQEASFLLEQTVKTIKGNDPAFQGEPLQSIRDATDGGYYLHGQIKETP